MEEAKLARAGTETAMLANFLEDWRNPLYMDQKLLGGKLWGSSLLLSLYLCATKTYWPRQTVPASLTLSHQHHANPQTLPFACISPPNANRTLKKRVESL